MQSSKQYNLCSITGLAIQVFDLDGMKRFYGALFGMQFDPRPTSGMTVWRGTVGELELILAPMRRQPDFDGFPIHQLSLGVDDLERALEVALDAGGTLLQGARKLDGARCASLRDVDGNTLVLVQASGPQP
jgi:predicted enzyme related to lactoylglutathione lyase